MKRLITLCLLVFTATLLYPEDFTDIRELADQCGCEFRFDYWKEIYELRKGRASARFSAGSPWYLVNMNELRSGIVSRTDDEGRFFIDSVTAGEVAAFFEKQGPSAGGIRYIVIDPGHGGKDPGAIGYYTVAGEKKQLKEKDVVLQTALSTAELLSARYPDREILLTRGDDRYLKLEERTEIANSVELADGESMIFISIHANASFNTTARGFEVWYLPPEIRRDLIDPDSLGGVNSDVIPILNTMLEEEYTIESVLLGEKLLSSLDQQIGELSINRGPKEESWFVVRNARMPSVLIELGFVTNQDEAVLLSSESYLKKLSKGIYNGVIDFIEDHERNMGVND